jgi:hypothetical protein
MLPGGHIVCGRTFLFFLLSSAKLYLCCGCQFGFLYVCSSCLGSMLAFMFVFWFCWLWCLNLLGPPSSCALALVVVSFLDYSVFVSSPIPFLLLLFPFFR